MTWDRYWDKEDLDSVAFADYTYGEEIWKAAREDLLKEQRKRRAKSRQKLKKQSKKGQ